MFTVGSGMLSSDVSYDFMLSIWALNWVFCGNVLEHCHAIQGFFPEERLVTLIASSWNFHLEISGKNIPSKMKFVIHPTTLSQSSKFKGALVFHPYFMKKDKRESKIHGLITMAIRRSSGSCYLFHPVVSPSRDHYLWHLAVWGGMSVHASFSDQSRPSWCVKRIWRSMDLCFPGRQLRFMDKIPGP